MISFHSLEDRIIKHYFYRQAREMEKFCAKLPRGAPRPNTIYSQLQPIGNVITPDAIECARNIRSRSAKLRVAKKVFS